MLDYLGSLSKIFGKKLLGVLGRKKGLADYPGNERNWLIYLPTPISTPISIHVKKPVDM